jgi:hypothetical protein
MRARAVAGFVRVVDAEVEQFRYGGSSRDTPLALLHEDLSDYTAPYTP